MAGNPFDVFDSESAGFPTVTVGQRDPVKAAADAQAAERADAGESRDEVRTGIAVRGEQRDVANTGFSQTKSLADAYNSDPTVKAYRVAMSQFAQALNTGDGAQADLALTYAFAKAMDPESVVRESEQGMVTASQPWFQAMVEKTKKQFGMDGAGNFTPEARDELRKQIANSVNQRQRIYDTRRDYYKTQSEAFGVNPEIVIGQHDKEPFLGDIQTWTDRINTPPADEQQPIGAAESEGLTGTVTDDSPRGTYQDSYLGQGMSGVNEGMAGVLGLPVDLTTAAMNLVPQGLNAVANTNIPTIQDPMLGSDWFKDRMQGWGIYDQSADPLKQFVRRTGESVGAAAVPAGLASTPGRILGTIAAGGAGGLGGATAQQVAPGNVLAEIAGETLAGGLGAGALVRQARMGAQRDIEAAIPTTEQLKQEAGQLYRQAENRGITADPALTQQFADDMGQTLRREGVLGPAGRISDADTNTTKAYNLVQQYAGQPMRPAEMDTVRRVMADGRNSPDPSDQRLAKILTDQFDDFVRPLAPEFDEARDVSSRYLQAEDLEQARELASARAGQFSGSGFENALRTDYRALDRNTIKGRDWFAPEVSSAIQDVSRGTPATNTARAIGKLAPTSVVSAGMGMGVPAAIGMQMTGTPTGAALGALAGIAGTAGRSIATNWGIRNADIAELTARNGGAIPQAPALTPDVARQVALLMAIQQGKYLSE